MKYGIALNVKAIDKARLKHAGATYIDKNIIFNHGTTYFYQGG